MSQFKKTRLLSLLLALVMVFTCCGGVLAEEVDDTDAQIQKAYDDMKTAEGLLAKANEEADKADVAAKEAKAALDAAEAALIAAGIDPDNTEAAESETVKALKQQIADLQSQIDGGAIAKTSADLAAANLNKTTNTNAISEATTAIEQKGQEVTAKNAAITAADSAISSMQAEIELNANTITNNETRIAEAQTELDGMPATLKELEENKNSADGAVEALELQQAAHQAELDRLNTLSGQLTQQQAVVDEKIAANTAAQEALATEKDLLDDADAKLTDEGNKLTAAQTAYDAAKKAVEGLDIEALQNMVTFCQDNLDRIPSWMPPSTRQEAEKALAAAEKALEDGQLLDDQFKKANQELTKATANHAAAVTAQKEAKANWEAANTAATTAAAELTAESDKLDQLGKDIEKQKENITAAKAKVDALLENGNPEDIQKAAEEAYNTYLTNYDSHKAALEAEILTLTNDNLTLAAKNEQLPKDIEAKQGDLTTLQTELETLEDEKDALEDNKADLEAKATEIQNEINRLTAELEKITNETIPVLKAELEELQKQLEEAQTGSDGLIADYNAKKTAYDLAKKYYDAMVIAKLAAQVAYDEAYSKYMQLIGSTDCAHTKYEMTAFGNTFCLMKVAGLCTHNLGSCCSNLSTSIMANNIKTYVNNGDFQGLANEVESAINSVGNLANIYNELPQSVRDTIENALFNLVDSAANKAIDAAKEELKNAISSNVPAENYEAVAAAIDKAAEKIKEIKTALGKGELTEAEVESMLTQAAQSVLNKALNEIKSRIEDAIPEGELEELRAIAEEAVARIEALMAAVDNAGGLQGIVDSFKAEVEKLLADAKDQATAAAKAILNKALTEIKNLVDSAIANSNLDEIAQKVADAIARFEEAIENLPNREELKALISEFRAEVEAAVKAAYEKYSAAAKEHIQEKLAEIKAETEAFVEARIAELKAEIDAFLADKHICEYTMETVKAEVAQKVQAAIDEIKAYIKDKLEAAAGADIEQIKAEVKQVAAAIAAALNVDIDASEIEALIEKIITEIETNGEAFVTDKLQTIENYLDKLFTDAMESNKVTVPGYAPTCYQPGLTDGVACKCGNYVYVEQQEIAATGEHVYSQVGYTAPTCTVEGKVTYRCTTDGCPASYSVKIDAKGHTVVTDAAVEPTCTETGLTEGSHCEVCGEVIVAQTEIPAKGHTLVTLDAVAPTCTETGLTAGEYCEVCDYKVEQTEVPAAGHTLVTDEAVAPTCTETGLTAGEHCTVCDYKVEQTEVPATGHTLVTDEAVAPTCTETGLTAGEHCTVCDYKVEQEVVPATGHTEVTDEAVAPTCTETGLTEGSHCEVCGEVIVAQTEVPATGHTEVTVGVVAATCHTEGYTGDVVCEVCNETIEQGSATAVDPANHDGETELRDVLAPTMREEGYTGDLYCLGCETIIEKGSAVAKLPMEYVSTNVFSVGVELNELVADAKNDTMVTVIDLSVDGVQEFELVTGENLVVGKVIVTVENGMVTVTCDYYSHELFETRKFVNLLTSVDQLTEEAFTKSGFEFGKAVSIQDDLGGSTKVLLVIDNDVSYPVDLEFVSFSADAAYEQLVADMLKILE